MNVSLRECGDAGKPVVVADPESPAAQALIQIAEKVAAQVSIANLSRQNRVVIE